MRASIRLRQEASADKYDAATRRSFSAGGQAQHEELFFAINAGAIVNLLILSLSKDTHCRCKLLSRKGASSGQYSAVLLPPACNSRPYRTKGASTSRTDRRRRPESREPTSRH